MGWLLEHNNTDNTKLLIDYVFKYWYVYQCCGAETICFGSSSSSDLSFVGNCFHSF